MGDPKNVLHSSGSKSLQSLLICVALWLWYISFPFLFQRQLPLYLAHVEHIPPGTRDGKIDNLSFVYRLSEKRDANMIALEADVLAAWNACVLDASSFSRRLLSLCEVRNKNVHNLKGGPLKTVSGLRKCHSLLLYQGNTAKENISALTFPARNLLR